MKEEKTLYLVSELLVLEIQSKYLKKMFFIATIPSAFLLGCLAQFTGAIEIKLASLKSFFFQDVFSFLHPLSVIQGGLGTLWGDLTFCHQADYVACRFIPFKPPTQAHNTSRLHWGLSYFSKIHGSVRSGHQGFRKTTPTQT